MVSCAMNMTAGQSDDPGKVSWDSLKDRVKKLWDSSPEPVKCFPWNEALDNFIQLIADLVLAVIKYLCVPLLAVTSLSEMSYCAHEKKLFVVPFPLIVGFSVAEVMRQTALSLSPILKVRFGHYLLIMCELNGPSIWFIEKQWPCILHFDSIFNKSLLSKL